MSISTTADIVKLVIVTVLERLRIELHISPTPSQHRIDYNEMKQKDKGYFSHMSAITI